MIESPLNLMKKFSVFTVGPVIAAFIGFLIIPITTWFVSPDEFGKAAMYTVVISMTSLVSILGLDGAFVREFYLEENKNKLLQNTVLIPILMSIVLSVLMVLNIETFSIMLFGEVDRLTMIFIVLAIIFKIFQRFNLMLIRSLELGWTYSLNMIIEKLINAIVLIFLLFFYKTNFASIIISQVTALMIATLLLMIRTRKYWFSKFIFDYNLIKKTLSYGLPLAPSLLMTFLLSSTDKVFLKVFSTYEQIGIYEAAYKIVALVIILQVSFSTFWTPTAIKWFENKVANSNFSKIGHLVTSISLFSFTAIIMLSDWIILILDPAYAAAVVIIPFLLLGPIMEILMLVTGKGITFSRKSYYHLYSSGVAVILNIFMNYLLIPNHGALGASIATGCSFIVLFWIRTFISRKLWYQFDLGRYALALILMSSIAINAVFLEIIGIEILLIFCIILFCRKDFLYVINIFKEKFIKIPIEKRNN